MNERRRRTESEIASLMKLAPGRVAELATALGVRAIHRLPGCWEYQIDEQWWIAINGHDEPVTCSTGARVDPFHIFVTYNGWPAGILTPFAGTLAAGAAANEETFIAAIEAAIRRAGGVPLGEEQG